MKPIPISAAEKIAKTHGYDQIVIIARKVGEGEHVTTYGVTKAHCTSAALQGTALKKLMGWPCGKENDGVLCELKTGHDGSCEQ